MDLSPLLDSDSRAALGQAIASTQRLVSALARFTETGILDDETLSCALWDLAEDLSFCGADLRKQHTIKSGESVGLFCHWDDRTGMQIWRLLTAIKAAGDAVEEVAYWLTRACEDAEDQPGTTR